MLFILKKKLNEYILIKCWPSFPFQKIKFFIRKPLKCFAQSWTNFTKYFEFLRILMLISFLFCRALMPISLTENVNTNAFSPLSVWNFEVQFLSFCDCSFLRYIFFFRCFVNMLIFPSCWLIFVVFLSITWEKALIISEVMTETLSCLWCRSGLKDTSGYFPGGFEVSWEFVLKWSVM